MTDPTPTTVAVPVEGDQVDVVARAIFIANMKPGANPERYENGWLRQRWGLRNLAQAAIAAMAPKVTVEQFVAVFESYGDDYDMETVHDLVALANGQETKTAATLGATE